MKLSENIKWMYGITKGVRVQIVLYILFGVCSIAASLMTVWLTKSLVDMAVKGAESTHINLYVAFLAGVIVLQQLFFILRTRISYHSATTLMNNLRISLFDRVMRSEWHGKELRHTGDVVNRIEGDSRTLSEALCITIPSVAVTLLQFVASFRFLHVLDHRLAWTIAAIMPIALIVSRRYLFTMRSLTQAIRTTDSSVQSHIQEQIQNRTLINTIGDTSSSVATLAQWGSTLLSQTMRRVNYTLYSRTIVQIGFGAGYVIAILWGIYGLRSEAVTFGMMTAFLQLVAQVQRPAVELATQISTTAKSIASSERLQEICDMQYENNAPNKALQGKVGIRTSELDYEYPDGGGRKILSELSCDFAPNTLHVIIGQTGAGKSTLIRLMLGLLTPNKGTIELYNDSGESLHCSATTRNNFIYVPQGNTLMSGTIRQNLLLANPAATQSELEAALKCAAAEFVFELPDGIETLCGERGAGLSEGEAQRIAIARGLLQKGSVILLDEPTSALDAATEELLMERLTHYAQNRTLIMVTHRDTAAKLCASVVRIGTK